MVGHSSIMAGETNISIPDAGVGEVARAFGQRGAVRPLHYLDAQADGRNPQRSQAAVGVVEVAGHLRIAGADAALDDVHGAAAGDLGHGEITTGVHRGVLPGDDGTASRAAGGVGSGAAHRVDQPAAERAGDEVGGQVLAAAGEVAGGGSETGRDQRRILAPVHIGVLPFVDGIV